LDCNDCEFEKQKSRRKGQVMKAIVVHEFGEPDVMKWEEVTEPVVSAGEVVVRVRAAGVNPVDTYIRSGRYGAMVTPPYTPGIDAAGEVENIGEGVQNFQIGDRVYTAGLTQNTYAERVLVKENQLRRLPENLSFAQGAAINVAYASAYRALFQRAKIQPGESVLIHGASGGVGLAALQLARSGGFTIFATAGSEEGLQLLREQGAHHVFNHREQNYLKKIANATGNGVDVILEMLANVNLNHDLELLAPRGRVVIVGSRGEVTIDPRHTMAKESAILGMRLFNTPSEDFVEIFDALDKGLNGGSLNPLVGREFSMSEAAHAHEAVMEPGARGKIVLIP
jgi:NADPH:quinone reductase